jgi:hypothetical protein
MVTVLGHLPFYLDWNWEFSMAVCQVNMALQTTPTMSVI